MKQKDKQHKVLVESFQTILLLISLLIPLLVIAPFFKIDFKKDHVKSKEKEPLVIQPTKTIETGLVKEEGWETVYRQCTACHSDRLVVQNRLSRQGWKDLIIWMQETQGLWQLGENEVVILDYLEKNYAPKKQGRRKPLKIKEWYMI